MKARIRLIDANKLQTTTTYFGISDTPVEVVKKSVIDNAKTVEAVPLSVIEDIKAEIEAIKVKEVACIEEDLINGAFDDALDIIDRKIAEVKGDKA